ncbi:hypothetical protein IFM89_003540 [Coptis chinensis]|uniref:Cytochrome P450 n=1 Tax=Coptis chinensis TaxID=261450 RepID=A0A835IUW5_9MAGN|nr:hypothetical protein IFM89_003540 [Coptis chinensis]
MDYLQAALSEALRLYPSVPLDHKEVLEDDVFPDDTILKKGTKVIYAIYAMGKTNTIWGKDCRECKYRQNRNEKLRGAKQGTGQNWKLTMEGLRGEVFQKSATEGEESHSNLDDTIIRSIVQ